MTALKIWKTKSADADLARKLAAEMNLPPILANVLSGYNFADIESAAKFLDPRLKDISDPFLIPQMEAAVERIWRAVAGKERILIYGDYDVDGIVSVVLLMRVLSQLGAGSIIPCLPDRLNEGYGLTIAALRRCLPATRPDLVITVDCGVTAIEAARFIKQSAIDLIVTDHHEVGGSLPEALAIVNPKLGCDNSPKILAGVGVVFKLCHALLKDGRRKGLSPADLDLKEYLDLVAVGTVADLVPLLEENRILVRHGLAKVNSSNALAWRALKEIASLNGRIDTYHLAFCIAPRLNAAGRLATAETALELFMTDDESQARAIAGKLDKANRERQAIEKQILKEAVEEIDGYFDPAVHFGLAVGRRAWHVGVIGIVASRLAAKYHRPVVVVGFDNGGSGRGSARSIVGYNILHGLAACRSELQEWGGHEMAAGMEIDEKKFDEFRRLFNQATARELAGQNLRPIQTINAWIQLADVSDENYCALERLAPFGQDNPKPVFAARGVKITGSPRVMAGKHLRFTVSDGKTNRNAIAFNHAQSVTRPAGGAANMADGKLPDGPLDLAFHIRKNTFNGSEKLELNILDYRKSGKD